MKIIPPIDAKAEQIAALARGVVQAVPLAGGLLAESIDLWANPIEKRKVRWIRDVSESINKICDELGMLPSTLAEDDRFISFLMQATLVALRNHQDEKLLALKFALTSSTDASRFSEDESFIFLRYVDELTPTHLLLLSELGKHVEKLNNLSTIDEIYSLVITVAPNIERFVFRLCLRDLASRSLIVFDDLDDFPEYVTKRQFYVTSSSGKRPLTLTESGLKFLEFVVLGSGRTNLPVRVGDAG